MTAGPTMLTDDEIAAWMPPGVDPDSPRGLVPSVEVCRTVGITYRMLDYWVRSGYVHPSRRADGMGTRRGFTTGQVREVQTVAALSRIGADLTTVAEAVAIWRRRGRPDDVAIGFVDGIPTVATPEDVAGLLADGHAVLFAPAPPPWEPR